MHLPFMKLPIVVGAPQSEAEALEDKDTFAYVIPTDIRSMHPGYHWGSFIYCESGHVFCTRLEVDEVIDLMKKYWETINSNPKIQTFQ